MSALLRPRWLGLLFVATIAVYFAGKITFNAVQRANLYAAGEAAATAENWPEAFSNFYILTQLDPIYRDTGARLAEAGQQILRLHPAGLDVGTEIKLLRWLTASGQIDDLAAVLDRSMVVIPAGEFTMGCDTAQANEQPERQVYLDVFMIDRYEVTNAQYQRFVQETGSQAPQYWRENAYPAGQVDHPVVGVSWLQAQAYCTWAGKRLPTEAEWEKVCRGSTGTVFPWGDDWQPGRANVGNAQLQNWPDRLDDGWKILQRRSASSDWPGLQPVGSYPAGQSGYGVFDLVGNASEWVADWYNWQGYWDLPLRNPISTGPPWNHSIRGSGWFDRYGRGDLIQDLSRCSARNSSHSYDDPRLGFRCARSVQ